MLNEASRWRLALARKVAPIIATNPKVQAVMLGGSASRGWADGYSDIEIGVFWAEPPTDEERMAHIEPSEGVFWELDPYDDQDKIWMEEWGLGGVKMDMRNLTVTGMENILYDVLDRYDTSSFKQATASAVLYGIPLYNAPLLEEWKARLAHYPDGLRQAMVEENLLIGDWAWVEVLVKRNDLLHAYRTFLETIEAMVGVLMGLNRMYHSGIKWLDKQASEMQIVPTDFSSRINTIFHMDTPAASQEIRKLVLEVFDLVESHLPQVDIQSAKRAFLRQRALFEQAPVNVFRT